MKMIYKRKNKKTKAEAITQIFILIISIIAISWMIGGEIEEVGAVNETANATSTPIQPCTSKFCVGKYVYGSKRNSAGACIVDTSQPYKEYCPTGCVGGVCNLDTSQSTSSGIGFQEVISTASLAVPVIEKAVEIVGGGAAATGAGAGGLSGGSALGTASSSSSLYSVSTGEIIGEIGGAILEIVGWAAVAFLVGRYGGELLGLSISNSQALGYALAAGTAAYLITGTVLEYIGGELATSLAAGPLGLIIGVVVAAVTFIILYKNASADIITYNCFQWDAQSGKGLTPAQKKERCELCNSQKDLVCTEYQCRSLGQGCILLNDESTGRQLCIWNNPNDITPPVIKPWEEALIPDQFKYTPDNTISPPDKGVKVAYTGNKSVSSANGVKCAPPFTPVSFGVKLDEAAKCKINSLNIKNYSLMADIFMGNGIRDFNHSFTLSLPSREALEAENFTVDNGGKYELYVRCEDANGNSNIGNFVFKFCISQGPDTTPPLILGTDILDNQPIAYGQKSMNLNLYLTDQTFTKAAASCRWSRLDKSYAAMEGNMSCTHSLLEMNAQMAYTCKTNLTGLKDSQNNKFYFRCIDDMGNANTESYTLNLIGTQPLNIESAGPNGTIRDSTNAIKVNLTAETTAGNDEGKAICSFSETGKSGSYVDFFYGYNIEPFSQYQHSQELWLEKGNYKYYIRCRDRGGNIDNANVSFKVETDTSSPLIVRVYKEENYLKLITDEPGECVYSTFGCNYLFKDGTPMDSLDEKEYYAEWNINQDYYIKCKDDYGNQPLPNVCSIVVRPFEIFELQ